MAQNQMYNPTQAALYGPDLLARQLRLQQSQQYGQQMLEQGQQAPQGQMVSGHYVAPSITQYLSQGLKSYAGRKAMDDLPDQVASLGQAQDEAGRKLFFGAAQPSQQALATALSAQGQPQGNASTQMDSTPGQPSPQTLGVGLAKVAPAQNQPMMPRIPGRSDEESYQAFRMLGPQEYMKLVVQQGTPTEIQKNLIAQGVKPGSPQWNQALSDSTFKSGYVPPTSAAPGATLIDPRTGRPTFSAPQNGVQTQYGPNGQATASQVPGFAQAQAGIAGAETAATEAAKAGLDLVNVPDGQGGTVQMPRSQAVQALEQGGVAGAAGSGQLGVTPNKQTVEAQTILPKVAAQADSMISSIDGLLNHPGLSKSVGIASYLPAVRGTDRADFETRSAQLQGQAFLQAFNDLKGGGQITEVEGSKATAAIGRMSTAQSEKEYKNSLAELRGILNSAKERAYQKAGVPMPKTDAASADKPAAKPDRNALMQEARRRGLIK